MKKKLSMLGIIVIIISLYYLIEFNKFNTPLSYVLYLVMSFFLILICIYIYDLINIVYK